MKGYTRSLDNGSNENEMGHTMEHDLATGIVQWFIGTSVCRI